MDARERICVFGLVEQGLLWFWELGVIQPKEQDLSMCSQSSSGSHTYVLRVFSGDVHGCFRLDQKGAVEVNLPMDPFTVLWILDQKEV